MRKFKPAIYEVEALLDTKRLRGKNQYLVKWKGYGETCNSWEPETNLDQELINWFKNNTFEIEKLLEKRLHGGEIEYLVKWKVPSVDNSWDGCDYAEYSWEPEANIPRVMVEWFENHSYEIEDLLGKRRRHGKKEYLVKWKGWASSDNSWEPEENIDSMMVDDFESQGGSPQSDGKITRSHTQQEEVISSSPHSADAEIPQSNVCYMFDY